MNETEFCYWLRGFFELSGATTLTQEQIDVVRKHLELVFNNVTTSATEITEGSVKKNVNGPPTTPRPAAPRAQVPFDRHRKLCSSISDEPICLSDVKFC